MSADGAVLAVWWLTEDDYRGYEPSYGPNPLKLPDYVWEEFCSRSGRPGRGRLWVPSHIDCDGMPVEEDDPRWPDYMSAGGIVIEAKDAASCLLWGGRVTTLTLDEYAPTNEPDDKDAKIATLRAALAGLIGTRTREELQAMEAMIRSATAPAADKAATIDAIHALLETEE